MQTDAEPARTQEQLAAPVQQNIALPTWRLHMRLILVRHGDPDYQKDCLTELGHRQAENVVKRLLGEGIEEIYSSPMGRARQTAEPFARESGIGTVHILDFMREIRFGPIDALYTSGNPWTGSLELIGKGADLQSPEWRNYPEFVNNTATTDIDDIAVHTDEWLATFGFQREGLYYRCTNAGDRKKTIVLFSHGGSSTALLSRVLNIPFPHLCCILGHLQHTSVSVLRFDGRPGILAMPVIEIASDSTHLKSFMGELAERPHFDNK